MTRLPTATADWLRDLATLVERRLVDVIKCDLRSGGVVLGVIAPQPPDDPRPRVKAHTRIR